MIKYYNSYNYIFGTTEFDFKFSNTLYWGLTVLTKRLIKSHKLNFFELLLLYKTKPIGI